MTGPPGAGNDDRLSIRTLVIASVASAAAALVTSRFWAPGTAFAAALTPVIISIVSELLHRPAEHVSRRRASRRAASPASIKPPTYEPPDGRSGAPETPFGQTTRAHGRRRLHLKLALLTGVLAFAIAAAALTLPELIFGRAATTNRDTTIFGGDSPKEQAPQPTETRPQPTDPAPPEKPPSETTGTTPRTSSPANRQRPPTQTAPAGETTPTP
jgi:MFS family permease